MMPENEVYRAFMVAPSWAFMLGCYFLWMHTYCISRGHYLIGQAAVLALTIYDITLTYDIASMGMDFQTHYADKIRPLSNLAMTAWVFYNGWFFYRYPVPVRYLQAESVLPRSTAYRPKNRLASALIKATTTRKFWFSPTFKVAGFCLLVLIMLAYGLERTAVRLLEGQRRSEIEAKKARTEVVEVKTQLDRDHSERLSQAHKDSVSRTRIVGGIEQVSAKVDRSLKNDSTVKATLKRTLAKPTKALNITIHSDPKPGPVNTPNFPGREVKPLPAIEPVKPGKRGRRTAETGTGWPYPDTSSYFARTRLQP